MSQVQEKNDLKEEAEKIPKYKDSTVEAYTINRRKANWIGHNLCKNGFPKHVTEGEIELTLRRLMSYIYIYMEHPFLMFLDHTQW